MPKIIHFFWEGGGKTRLAKRCIASWRKMCPDWEIKEWNLERLRQEGVPIDGAFFEETVRLKAWAFVSDVVRWAVLYREGGVFLDADVELVKPIDELCCQNWMVAECEEPLRVNPGFGMSFERGSTFAAAQLENYAKMHFDAKRPMNCTSPWVVSQLLDRSDAPKVYPIVYFNPREWSGGRLPKQLDSRTYGIHHYADSWFSWKQLLAYKILPRFGIDVGKILRRR